MFVYQPYRSPFASSIADTLLRRGDIAAQQAERIGNANANAALQSGQAWAGAAQGIGNAVSGALQQATDPRLQLARQDVAVNTRAMASRTALADAFKTTPLVDENGLKLYDIAGISKTLADQGFGDAVPEVAPHLEALNNGFRQEAAAKLALVRQGAESVAAAGNDPVLAHHFLDTLEANHTYPKDQIDQFRAFIDADPANVPKLTGYLAGPQKPVVLAGAARPGASPATAVNPVTGQVIATGAAAQPEAPKPEPNVVFTDAQGVEHPVMAQNGRFLYNGQDVTDRVRRPAPAAKAETLGSSADYITKWATDKGLDPTTLTAAQTAQALKEYRDSTQKAPVLGGMNALYQQTDPKALAAAIQRGELPPETSRFGRPIGAAVESELAKNGYNLSTAVTDWKATQKHIATLNGPQQTRLNQSINALPDLLDSVDALASQWQAGKFPLLNKANLALAKNGVYGKDAASIANQLDSQIADVVADLGTVYMGGNTPTDHSLALAAKSLNTNWDAKVLHDMTAMARSNVQIRRNSILNTGVQGASAENPYEPPPPATPPTPSTSGYIFARDARGVLHRAKAGTPLPKGWTLTANPEGQ